MSRRSGAADLEKDLLAARLEASELKHTVEKLRRAVSDLSKECREQTRLLLRQRLPRRPTISSTQSKVIAASQRFCCPDPFGSCHLKILNDSLFDDSLWEIDHKDPWSQSGKHTGNELTALCVRCHSIKTRRDLAAMGEQADSDREPDDG